FLVSEDTTPCNRRISRAALPLIMTNQSTRRSFAWLKAECEVRDETRLTAAAGLRNEGAMSLARLSNAAAFARYVGIDYSGAQTPTSSLKGLRVYMADRQSDPVEVIPPPSPRKYWTRHGVAEWVVERLREEPPTLVGLDHGFSFPLQYFETHGLPLDWP